MPARYVHTIGWGFEAHLQRCDAGLCDGGQIEPENRVWGSGLETSSSPGTVRVTGSDTSPLHDLHDSSLTCQKTAQ